MYGFKVTVSLEGEEPDDMRGRLDEVTNQLAIMHSREREFADFMVTRHVSGDVTYLIVVQDGADLGDAQALSMAVGWLRTAVNAAGFGTPGWLKFAEQVQLAEQVRAQARPDCLSGLPRRRAAERHRLLMENVA